MFIGHFAVAFAAKRTAPTVSLGTLFLACQLADLIWPNLVPRRRRAVRDRTRATPPSRRSISSRTRIRTVWSRSVRWAALAAVIYKLVRRIATRCGPRHNCRPGTESLGA